MKLVPLLLCGALLACQVARHSSAEHAEQRLRERNHGSPPPLIAVANYAQDERELLTPGLLQTGQVIAASSAKPLPATTFLPGHSYRLTFSARALEKSQAELGIKFRLPDNASFRTFRTRVTRRETAQYQLEFSAPAFSQRPELSLEVSGAGVVIDALSLRSRPPISNTQPVTSWAASFVPEGYGLVFNDEFDGSELDRTRWFTRYIYGSETVDRLNKENQHYTDNGNHRLAGGVLYLTAQRLKPGLPSGIDYESGMIRSDFTARYGFFEARLKVPSGLGVWPAFWLNSDVSATGVLSWPPEIDIFELVNNGKEDKLDMLHVGLHNDAPGKKTQNSYVHPRFDTKNSDYTAPFEFSDGWHTIGAEWTPKDVSIYVDGLKVVSTAFEWRYHDGSLAAPAHLLFNLAIGDEWAGRHGIDDSAFPQSFAIDWVRVYQRVKPG